MPRIYGDVDLWASLPVRKVAFALRKYGLRILLLLAAFRLLWILLMHAFG